MTAKARVKKLTSCAYMYTYSLVHWAPGPSCMKQLKIKWDFFATIPFVLEDFLVWYHG